MRFPETVYFLGALADVSDERGMFAGEPRRVCLIGLFDVLEFHPYEPSAYVWDEGFTVTPHDQNDGPIYWVNGYVFDEQVNPGDYGRGLADEREMEFEAERS